MKVLFTSLYPMWHYHFVSELNLMEKHLQRGDEVLVLICHADQNNCEANPGKDLFHCARCIGIRQHGLHLLSKPVTTHSLISKSSINLPHLGLTYENLDDLKKLRLGDFDIGSSVYSSLVNRTKSKHPSLKDNRAVTQDLLRDAARIYLSGRELVEKENIELVYIFNGRYAGARPWLRICQSANIDYIVHEKSRSLKRIQLFHQDIPHNPDYYPPKMEGFWLKVAHDQSIVEQAHQFFTERPQGKITGWKSFIAQQDRERLPPTWSKQRRNVAIFTSSDFEYAAIDAFQKYYKGQSEQYLAIISQAVAFNPQLEFYMRIHPNSKDEREQWWDHADFQKLTNFHIIYPEEKISSYALLHHADVIISSHSTIGIEATYWGKPSIIINRAFYSNLDAVYETHTPEQVVQLLLQDLPPKPQENALKYGAYYRCAGELLPLSEPVNYYTLDFKGKILEARREVHEWLGECEKRPEVLGIKKWLQVRKDRRDFKRLWIQCDGWFAESPKK
jgi:hypothetical protein